MDLVLLMIPSKPEQLLTQASAIVFVLALLAGLAGLLIYALQLYGNRVYKKGYWEGHWNGESNGLDVGYERGFKVGRIAGYDHGYSVGYTKGYDAGCEQTEEEEFLKREAVA